MKTVRDMLSKKKSSTVWSVGPKETVFEALRIMGEKKVGALMVMDGENNAVGILSERDYARKIALEGRNSKETAVEEIMTPRADLCVVNPDTTMDDCMVLITAKKIRHLPVFEHGQFLGLISIGDVIKAIIMEKESVIEELSNYIAGKYV